MMSTRAVSRGQRTDGFAELATDDGEQLHQLGSTSSRGVETDWRADRHRARLRSLWGSENSSSSSGAQQQHTQEISWAAWSPAADSPLLASVSFDGSLCVTDVEAQTVVWKVDELHKHQISQAAWCADGRRIATASRDKSCRVVDVAEQKAEWEVKCAPEGANSVCWCPREGSRSQLAIGSGTGAVWIVDVDTKQHLWRFDEEHTKDVTGVAWSPAGTELATVSSDGRLCVGSFEGAAADQSAVAAVILAAQILPSEIGERLRSLGSLDDLLLCNVAAEAGVDEQDIYDAEEEDDEEAALIALIQKQEGIEEAIDRAREAQLRNCSISELRICAVEAKVDDQELDACLVKWRRTGDGSPMILAVDWSPDGSRLVIGSADHAITLIDAQSDGLKLIWRLSTMHSLGVMSVKFSPDGKHIASASADKTTCIIDSEVQAVAWRIDGTHAGRVSSANWSGDGAQLVTASWDKTVFVHDLPVFTTEQIFTHHSNHVRSVAWSTGGKILASGSFDGTVQLMGEDHNMRVISSTTKRVQCLAWNPVNTSQLAVSSSDPVNPVRIYDTVADKDPWCLEGQSDTAYSVAWSPDGTQLASGAEDGVVCIWNIAADQKPTVSWLMKKSDTLGDGGVHTGPVMSVSWNSAGTHLATGTADAKLNVLAVLPQQVEICLVDAHGEAVNSVAWASDGRLAAGSADRTVSVWARSGDDDGTPSAKWTRLWHSMVSCHPDDGPVFTVAWSPDCTMLATGSGDSNGRGRVTVLDVTMNEPRVVVIIDGEHGSQKPVRSVAWTPDSCRLASGAEDNTVCVMDIRKPFEAALELLMCARSTMDWRGLAVGLAESVSTSAHSSLLLQQSSVGPLSQNEERSQAGWTVFHELASCERDIRQGTGGREGIWTILQQHCAMGAYTPLSDASGRSALDIAIGNQDATAVEFFCSRLDMDANLEVTASVTNSLILLAEKMPRQITKVLRVLEAAADHRSRYQRRIRHLQVPLDDGERLIRCSDTADATTVWVGKESEKTDDNQFECDCMLQLLALRDIAGYYKDIKRSPYHILINECPEQHEDQLFKLKVIAATTDFKWQAFAASKTRWRLFYYSMHFALAAMALLWTTRWYNEDGSTVGSVAGSTAGIEVKLRVADALMVCMTFSNTVSLWAELSQVCHDGIVDYIKNGWNQLDAAGIVALYGSAAAYFFDNMMSLRYIGALGFLLNSFSFLQLLRPFDVTGPIIKMTIEIVFDRYVKGFICVTIVLIVGFSVALSISMPESDSFGLAENHIAGPFHSLLIVFQSMLGAFDLEHYEHIEAIAMFVIFAFVMVVVMLNLLIAIMGAAYEGVKENAELEKNKLRAEVIMDIERDLSDSDLRNPEWFPHYVQTLELHHFEEGTDSANLDKRLNDLEATVQETQKSVKNIEALLQLQAMRSAE